MSVICQVPLNSKVLMAVMFCEGLPCSEKPPSTVWLASGVGAYWKLAGLETSKPKPMSGVVRPLRKSTEKLSVSIASMNVWKRSGPSQVLMDRPA